MHARDKAAIKQVDTGGRTTGVSERQKRKIGQNARTAKWSEDQLERHKFLNRQICQNRKKLTSYQHP